MQTKDPRNDDYQGFMISIVLRRQAEAESAVRPFKMGYEREAGNRYLKCAVTWNSQMISSPDVKGARCGDNTSAFPGFTTWGQSAEVTESDDTLRKCLDMPNDSRRDSERGSHPVQPEE